MPRNLSKKADSKGSKDKKPKKEKKEKVTKPRSEKNEKVTPSSRKSSKKPKSKAIAAEAITNLIYQGKKTMSKEELLKRLKEVESVMQ